MYRENPEEADDRQYYDYNLDRNGSSLEPEKLALRQPDVIGSVCDHPDRNREYYREGCYKCWKCHKIIVAN